MDTKYIDAITKLAQSELKRVEVDGLPPFWFGPLTIKQAIDIEAEQGDFMRIARQFQVRAKDEDGKLLVKAGLEFDKFLAQVPVESITGAVVAMQKEQASEAETEKNL